MKKFSYYNFRLEFLVCFFLVSITLAVYWQVINNEFIDFDDDLYVTENTRVKGGLTMENVVWAFTTTHAANWHPVTWLSHMLDIQLFGMNPGLHHLINVFFHIANTVLLFFVFRRMTGDVWRSSLIAALFSIHPLHVETVAWIAERKDVLSTSFLMLAIWSFIGYVDRPKTTRYLTAFLFFSLGLMAKPMIVTLPFVLLLLDYWPLQRIQFINDERQSYTPQWPTILYLIREKLPFFFLAVGSIIVTVIAQQSGGALRSLEAYPFHIRMANALVSYVTYFLKMIWPFHLSVYYPYRSIIPVWQVFAASLLIIFITVLVIRTGNTRPWFAVGWLWYIGTLGPVIGLLQVGSQAMADRYTYVPLIGLFIMIAWGVPERATRQRYQRVILFAITAIILSGLTVASAVQVQYWNNTVRLLEHAVNVVPDNYSPRNNLGFALEKLGRTQEAIAHYSKALRLNPNYKEAHNNLGLALAKQGNAEEAKRHYIEALRIDPGFQEAHNNLGNILAARGKTDEAIQHYSEALRLDPEYKEAHHNLGVALFAQGDLKGAVKHFFEAIRIKPDYVDSHINLGVALAAQGRVAEAISHFREALRIRPDDRIAKYNLEGLTIDAGKRDRAPMSSHNR